MVTSNFRMTKLTSCEITIQTVKAKSTMHCSTDSPNLMSVSDAIFLSLLSSANGEKQASYIKQLGFPTTKKTRFLMQD